MDIIIPYAYFSFKLWKENDIFTHLDPN